MMEAESSTFTLDLRIPDIRVLLTDDIYSPPVERNLLKWSINVERDADDGVAFLAVYLMCTKDVDTGYWEWECKATYRITLKDQHGHPEEDVVKESDEEGYTFMFHNSGDRCYDGFYNMYEFDKLLQGKNGFVVDYAIHIQIEVSADVPTGLHIREKMQIQADFENGRDSTTTGHILRMLESGEGFDTVIVVAKDNVEFKAHHGILAARSQVFAAMFDADMTEAATRKVTLKHVTATSCKALLRFIYTGDCSHLEKLKLKEVKQLINAGEKYGLPELKKYCGYLLTERCRFENAIKMRQFANRYGLHEADREIYGFVEQNFPLGWLGLVNNKFAWLVDSPESDEEMEIEDSDD